MTMTGFTGIEGIVLEVTSGAIANTRTANLTLRTGTDTRTIIEGTGGTSLIITGMVVTTGKRRGMAGGSRTRHTEGRNRTATISPLVTLISPRGKTIPGWKVEVSAAEGVTIPVEYLMEAAMVGVAPGVVGVAGTGAILLQQQAMVGCISCMLWLCLTYYFI